jgi:hypothetical protein
VNGKYWGLQIHVRVKASIAKLQAELILTLRPETAVALMAGTNLLVMRLFAGVNFGMDFNHCGSPVLKMGKSPAMPRH